MTYLWFADSIYSINTKTLFNSKDLKMKLLELKSIAIVESHMSERHMDLQDAIADEFGLDDEDMMIDKIRAYLDGEESDKMDDFLYDHFMSDMPYGTRKARDGDPKNWIANHMGSLFNKYTKSE